MSRLPAAALAGALLVLVYALALGSFKPLDLGLGALVSATVLVGFRRALFPSGNVSSAPDLLRRTLGFPRFVAAVAWDLVTGTALVASVVLGFRRPTATGIVIIPMGERSEVGVVVSSIVVTLTPGEVVLDLDWDRRLMLVHTIDASDPAATRAALQHFYERFQRPVFP